MHPYPSPMLRLQSTVTFSSTGRFLSTCTEPTISPPLHSSPFPFTFSFLWIRPRAWLPPLPLSPLLNLSMAASGGRPGAAAGGRRGWAGSRRRGGDEVRGAQASPPFCPLFPFHLLCFPEPGRGAARPPSPSRRTATSPPPLSIPPAPATVGRDRGASSLPRCASRRRRRRASRRWPPWRD